MKLYHKVFKSHADMSVYLANMDPLISYDEELLNRLTNARNTDELYDAKCSILRDFRDIYAFDASEAEFPEPIGHFDDEEEKKIIKPFLHNDKVLFYGTEKFAMEKLYRLFVEKGVLKNTPDNEMILTGVCLKGKRKLTRTLGGLLNSNFAKEEIRPEYLELLKNFFVELNIRNCIMHGLGETFDYLNIGLVAIMFQMLWDIVECEIFKD